MQVQLIDYTGNGTKDPARTAANLLVFTKQTRLTMDPQQFAKVEAMTEAEVMKELEYMANTIPSSWEFINYAFLINDVTRAFTHQFVRTRTGSYAQQTMRVLDVHGWSYGAGPTIEDDWEVDPDTGREKPGALNAAYVSCMDRIAETYDFLVANGAKIEDARGVLPTNINTNIVAKFDLRTMADTARKRASSRTQGEYRNVLDAMKAQVLHVHPWAALFFNRTFDVAASDLEQMINDHFSKWSISPEDKVKMIKLIDQMRATA